MSKILIPFESGDATLKSVRIMGVGGAGLAFMSHLNKKWEQGPDLLALDSDEDQLDQSVVSERILLTDNNLKGRSTGGDLKVGMELVQANEPKLRALFQNTKILILTGGLGGGTGGSVLPEICRLAREEDVVTVCLVSLPFHFEGEKVTQAARRSLLELKTYCGLLICCPLSRVSDLAKAEEVPLAKALACGAEHMGQCIQSMWSFLAQPGLIHLDVNRLQAICMHSGGTASMGSVSATGKRKIKTLVNGLAVHPYLDKGNALATAKGIVVLITGGEDLLVSEVDEVMEGLSQLLGRSADISFGATVQKGWKDRIAVTLIAAEEWSDWQEPAPEKPSEDPENQILMPIAEAKPTKRKKSKPKQVALDLEPAGKGRFRDVEPTFYEGEDLDIPSFRRKNIRLVGKY